MSRIPVAKRVELIEHILVGAGEDAAADIKRGIDGAIEAFTCEITSDSDGGTAPDDIAHARLLAAISGLTLAKLRAERLLKLLDAIDAVMA